MGAKEKMVSTVPGLKYPTGRDEGMKTGAIWLKGKQQDDGAEGLWRVGDKLYDLNDWVRNHPGGAEWLTLTKGTDITEAFEAHHITLMAERLLPKFYVRDAVGPRACPFTFKPDGFYRKFKARVREALKDVDIHRSSRTTNLIADTLLVTTLALCWTAAATQSWIAILASGVFLTWTTVSAHNFFHQRDNFRMYYFDLCLMSSKEWRISHVLSHHLYTNTLLDMEITIWEPVFQYLPKADKTIVTRYLSLLYFPVFYVTMFFGSAIKRFYSIFWESGGPDIRDVVPFLLPTLMCFAAPPATAVMTWLQIIAISSFHFSLIGLNAAHHHPDIYHDGDARREDMDWGLAELDTVRDRVEVQTSYLFVLTHFGSHSLHHLLPTVDHAYLYLCEPAFAETCKEFGIDTKLWTQWELVKGQFAQLGRIEPKKTPNTR